MWNHLKNIFQIKWVKIIEIGSTSEKIGEIYTVIERELIERHASWKRRKKNWNEESSWYYWRKWKEEEWEDKDDNVNLQPKSSRHAGSVLASGHVKWVWPAKVLLLCVGRDAYEVGSPTVVGCPISSLFNILLLLFIYCICCMNMYVVFFLLSTAQL